MAYRVGTGDVEEKEVRGMEELVARAGSEDRAPRATVNAEARKSLKFARRYSTQGVDPYSTVQWEKRDAVIQGDGGRVVFEQRDVEFPTSWSQLATNVVTSKYFRGPLGTPQRETSVRQLIERVVSTIVGWGETQGYFASTEDRDIYRDELTHLLLEQRACFNSPV